MGLRKNSVLVPTSSSVITKRHYRRDYRSSRPALHPQTDCRQTRARCRNPGHIGCSALSSLVRACWWCWPLWHCFTRTTITPVEPKSGLWRGDSWRRRVRQLLHRGIKGNITYRTRSFSCRTLYLTISVAPWKLEEIFRFNHMRYVNYILS